MEVGEIVKRGDECCDSGSWVKSLNAGLPQSAYFVYRRRIASPRTTKAIATRATVRAAFFDGAIADDVMRRDSGLSGPMMNYAMRRWEVVQRAAKIQGAKYIMLEIQREGEP